MKFFCLLIIILIIKVDIKKKVNINKNVFVAYRIGMYYITKKIT